MSQIIPILIPTYISAADYAPARVLPRVFFYNGLIDCETYNIESGSLTKAGIVKPVSQFPYFDNYNVVTGSFPTQGSDSLLFTNEAVAYGQLPSGSLYSEYWETYITLLYNPRTRLVNCDAIIPLAEYFKMELNDIVQWRSNYYHLRAINDYNLSNGECKLQLLGPVIDDVISAIVPTTYCDFTFTSSLVIPPPSTTTTTAAPTTTTTSTTTTTIAPTTTTTSTTSTTTTTLAPLPGICYCMTYDDEIGSLNVRYRALVGGVTTVAITSLFSIDNGDGTFTACICVLQGSSYAVPVCVMDGIEVTCGFYAWVEGQQCNQETNCFL